MNRNSTTGSDLDGVLLVDKPEGPTSHDVIESLRRSLGVGRCGHAGTLDPFASGLLVVGVGKATRLLRFLSGSDKSYEGTIRLGQDTDTDDRTGTPIGDPRPVRYSPEDLERSLSRLTGSFEQVSPDYSARKHAGVPHYRLARKGAPIPKRPSAVRVEWHECSALPGGPREDDAIAPCLLRIRVTASAGTYIRALARDLGAALGCGGHLEALRRVRSGTFAVEDASAPDDSPEALREAMLPLDAIPLALPSIAVGADAIAKLRCGVSIPPGAALPDLPGASDVPSMAPDPLFPRWVRILGPAGTLVALAEVEIEPPDPLRTTPREPRLQPRIVL